ncbi:MAG: YbaB/EbfC family nucleoid-associated protein [Ruminococcus sp.]|jgi:DNA-binding YbaB/EbfC family protein|nr:YbaB/EbfC family nucleoid-associated protein [Ruminococcus sp.]
MKVRLPNEFKQGGAQNMNQMITQAKQMQSKITELQTEIEERDFNVSVGGGAVEMVMSGKKEVKSLKIKPEVVDPADVESLEDLILSAFNQGVSEIARVTETEMEKVTGGVSLPGLF